MAFVQLLKRGTKGMLVAGVIMLPPGVYTIYKYRPRHSSDLEYHENLVRGMRFSRLSCLGDGLHPTFPLFVSIRC